MNEAAAREVVLLQALETVRPRCSSWTADDTEWASRLVRLDGGRQDDLDDLVARRARHARTRWAGRDPGFASMLARRAWRGLWVGSAMVCAAIVGALADSIGASQRVDLLAAPLWAVVGWNLTVYAGVLAHALTRWSRRGAASRAGRGTRYVRGLLRNLDHGSRSAGANEARDDRSRVLQTYWRLWSSMSAALWTARATVLLHAAAACLALGLIGGLYLRGLVLDYRAAWESTFLGAGAVHGFLATMFAPASALSGIAVPPAP